MTDPVDDECDVRYLEKRFGKNDDVYNVSITQLVKCNLSEIRVGQRTVYVISDAELYRVNSKFSNMNRQQFCVFGLAKEQSDDLNVVQFCMLVFIAS